MKQQKQVIRRRSLFDHIKEVTSIQHKTYWKKLSEEDKKTWSNFMVHRFLSMNPNWLELTNEIQRYDLKPEILDLARPRWKSAQLKIEHLLTNQIDNLRSNLGRIHHL